MPDTPTTPPFVQPGDLLPDFLRAFWQRQVDTAEQETPDFRHPPLPLARIKKVMKSDPEVKMIAADAPILFCKACEMKSISYKRLGLVFISEITARAFIVADANKRRTLSRSDIAKALSKSDQFDFLIDIVPREDGFPGAKRPPHASGVSMGSASAPSGSGSSPAKQAGQNTAVVKRDEDRERYSEVLEIEERDTRMSGEGLDELQSVIRHPQSMDWTS